MKLKFTLLISLILLFVMPTGNVFAKGNFVSLTFDDGYESTYTLAAPLLRDYGVAGTVYVTTSYIGMPGFMTWNQLIDLRNTYGWEVGSHTVSHPELPLLSLKEISQELYNSSETLRLHGFQPKTFASPFGAYDNRVISEAMKLYSGHRGFWDRDDANSFPYDRSVLMVQSVETGTSMNQVKSWIEEAHFSGNWLILVFHEIDHNYSPEYAYTNTVGELEEILSYINDIGSEILAVNEVLRLRETESAIKNYTFLEGLTGWSTDNSNKVKHSDNSRGAYPEYTNAVELTGSRKAAHLFGSSLAINPENEYIFEVFANTDKLTSGEVGFYLDEYNSAGEWISGQWLGLVPLGVVRFFTRVYIPTSLEVAKTRIQTYMTAGSKGVAYFDNYVFSPLNGVSEPTPTPTPTSKPKPTASPLVSPSPSPTPTISPSPSPSPDINLVRNGSFEELDEGWAIHWSQDVGAYEVNTNSLGNDGASAIILSGDSRAHLFSDQIEVSTNTSYIWSQYLDIKEINGEFGFYIDEYDAKGDWISGQWKGMIVEPMSGEFAFSYSPSSPQVRKAALQYYRLEGTTLSLILDSVSFLEQ